MRRRRSDRSDRPPSTPAQPSKRSKSRQGTAGCSRLVCGDEGPSEARVCSACNEPATMTAVGPRWNHFKPDEQVEDLLEAWKEWSSQPGVVRTDVKAGFAPTRDCCFCNRGTCFLKQARKWQLRPAEEAKKHICGVCEATKSLAWRSPGVFLMQFARYFTSTHAKRSRLYDSGGTLDGGSWLCQVCYFDGYRNAPTFFPKDKSTVEGYVNYLELDSTPPSKDTLAFAEQEVLLYPLRSLNDGELVYLADAANVMRHARKRAGVKSLNEESLRSKVIGMFRYLAHCVVGVDLHSFDGGQVGDEDKRVTAHYLMPSKFSPLYVARLHRGIRRLEQEREARSSTEGGVGGDGEQASAGTGAEGECMEPKELARKAGKMLRDDIEKWTPWRNSGRFRHTAQDLNIRIQPPAVYIRDFFPPRFAIFLAALCNVDFLLGEGMEGGSTHTPRAMMRGVVFVYMVGTMLGRFVIGQCFVPPHFLKVSQALKQRGVGCRPMGFLAALGICASDAVRWKREEHLQRGTIET